MRGELRVRSIVVLAAVSLSVGLSSCTSNGSPRSKKVSSRSAASTGGSSGGTSGGTTGSGSPGTVNTPPIFSVGNSSRSIVSAAKTLVQRLPDYGNELTVANEGEDGYRAALNRILNDGVAFREAMVNEHRAYLGVGGSRPDSNIDYDQPARLGAYLVINNLDYRALLTAKYCVNAQFQQVPCDSFQGNQAAANAHGAGVLSTRAYIATHKQGSPFNFRLVTQAFAKFACAVYPDAADPQGTAPEVVSSSYAPWGLRGGRPSECYICHKAMNAKAYSFYFFNAMGFFSANMDTTTVRSNNQPSPVSDVIVPGGVPVVKSRPVNTLGTLGESYVADPRFASCMVKRYVNFMLGRPYENSLPAGMESLVSQFEQSGYNVRELLNAIGTSGVFVNRGGSP
jgi:hypothetical protein